MPSRNIRWGQTSVPKETKMLSILDKAISKFPMLWAYSNLYEILSVDRDICIGVLTSFASAVCSKKFPWLTSYPSTFVYKIHVSVGLAALFCTSGFVYHSTWCDIAGHCFVNWLIGFMSHPGFRIIYFGHDLTKTLFLLYPVLPQPGYEARDSDTLYVNCRRVYGGHFTRI